MMSPEQMALKEALRNPEDRALEASLIFEMPKVPSKRYIGFDNGNKTRLKLGSYAVRTTSQYELIDVVWPESTEAVSASFLLGLFYEQLRSAESMKQFTDTIRFKQFKFETSLLEAYRLAKAMTKDQFDQMVKSGRVPVIH